MRGSSKALSLFFAALILVIAIGQPWDHNFWNLEGRAYLFTIISVAIATLPLIATLLWLAERGAAPPPRGDALATSRGSSHGIPAADDAAGGASLPKPARGPRTQEERVLDLFAEGWTAGQIASGQGITVDEVRAIRRASFGEE